ncbi:MAG: glycoside hydrolase family 172 protein [Verrucomicrobiota bacterium]
MKSTSFHGLGCHLGNLSLLSNAESRSISPENLTGEKGRGGMATEGTGSAYARDLGLGWKISPSILLEAGEVREIVHIEGPGAIQQIWMTPGGPWRNLILRIYWDDQEHPSVECPIGDFFASGWKEVSMINSLAVCVNPGNALNCYWEMPFQKKCRMTLTNLNDDPIYVYYQINYALTVVPEGTAYFHAQFRRTNPLPYKEVYTILEGVQGQGHYVGTYMAWGVNNDGWWGEGEIKFYMDGDTYPTICGTGTEDYFGGSYNFENKTTKQYQEYTTPYCGLSQIIRPDGLYKSQTRFGMYRWHIPDPIRFKSDLKVTMQALGWRSGRGEGRRYLPLQDDIASVAYWYQALPNVPFPKFPDRDALEII